MSSFPTAGEKISSLVNYYMIGLIALNKIEVRKGQLSLKCFFTKSSTDSNY